MFSSVIIVHSLPRNNVAIIIAVTPHKTNHHAHIRNGIEQFIAYRFPFSYVQPQFGSLRIRPPRVRESYGHELS